MYYQPRVRADKPFPLADNYFEPVALAGRRLEELRAEAATALEKTLVECTTYTTSRGTYLVHCPPWRLHAEQDGLSEYKRPHSSRPTTSVSRLFGTVAGHYLDVAEFFKSETRAEYVAVQKRLHNSTIDANVLYTVPQPKSKNDLTYEGIKWAAYEPFLLRFRMDSCHFESSGTGVDESGKPYAYRVVLPVFLPEVPDLFKAKRCVRMECKSVMVIMPSDRDANSTEIFMTMQNDFKSNQVPRSMYRRYMMSLHRIAAYVEGDRILSHTSASHIAPVPEDQRSHCGVCSRPFTMLRSKHQCSVCGEIVCRRCRVRSSEILAVKPTRLERREKSQTKICTPCIKLMKEDHEHVATTPMLNQDAWHKSPVRMSETPTEVSNEEASLTYIRGESFQSNDAERRSSLSDWTTTPTSHATVSKPRFSVEQLWHHRESVSSRHSSCSSASEVISVVGEPHEQIEYIDDEDVIYEEESELASNRSVEIMDLSDMPSNRSVDMIIDTSEMTRVRDDSVLNDGGFVAARSASASVISRSASSSVSSDKVFENIHSSLHEQEVLLRKLHQLSSSQRHVRREGRRSDAA